MQISIQVFIEDASALSWDIAILRDVLTVYKLHWLKEQGLLVFYQSFICVQCHTHNKMQKVKQ